MKPGLVLHRASRTEALAAVLFEQLDAEAPAAVLAPQEIVVAHPGLSRWLLQAYAVRRGAAAKPGIAANLRFRLPGQWLLDLLQLVLDEPGVEAGPYRRENLRWRIHALLPRLAEPALARWLDGPQGPDLERQFELADHLAGLYGQYLVYRREWLLAAEAGTPLALAGAAGLAALEPLQARLWQQLARQIGTPHRGNRMQALLAALARGSAAALPAGAQHLFGLNHLPPDTLQAVELLARHLPVHLYLVDPSHGYWQDLVAPRVQARAAAAGLDQYLEVGHPLLAGLGWHGQDFNRRLARLERVVELDQDHAGPDPETGGDPPLLARLQDSVRRLLPALAGTPLDTPARQAAARADGSLRIHACHTRLRELEVLRDALLDLLARHPHIHPRDIVVMAPDIAAYAALVPAVFGAPGSHEQSEPRHLPYQLADRSLGSLHPLLASFTELLQLPGARLGRSSVLALLAVPALARRLQLDGSGLEALTRWIERCRTAWGLDAAMKAELGAAAEPRHSWDEARDRLFLGFLAGPDERLAEFMERMPLAGVVEPQAAAIGALAQLLDALREARQRMQQVQPLRAWSEWLAQWVDQLFAADPDDRAEVQALAAIHAAIAALASQADAAGVDPAVSYAVVQRVLLQQLEAVPPQQVFLSGGITFSGMVPARVIPFEIIAMLGLNDEDYPRTERGAGLNLIEAQPREGDRSGREEDRYLFLESLMAARSAVHLSWLGFDPVRGEPRNPAGPLALLAEFLDAEHGLAQAGPEIDRPWQVEHALQPFAARYFDGSDVRLFSYSARYAGARPALQRQPLPPFVGRPGDPLPGAAGAGATAVDVRLAELLRFYRDSARHALHDVRGIGLEALDPRTGNDSEPLEPLFASLDAVPRLLFERARQQGLAALPAEPPAWLRGAGLMPPGRPGELAYARAADAVDAALALLRQQLPALLGAVSQASSFELELPAALAGGPARLGGSVRSFQVDGTLLLFNARIGRMAQARELLPLFIEWAALRLARPGQLVRVLQLDADRNGNARLDPRCADWQQRPAELLQRQLGRLLQIWRSAQQRPLPYFPKTSWTWANAPAHTRLRDAAAAWRGGYGHLGERDYQPPYAALLARGQEFLAEPRSLAEFAELAEAICGMVQPGTERA